MLKNLVVGALFGVVVVGCGNSVGEENTGRSADKLDAPPTSDGSIDAGTNTDTGINADADSSMGKSAIVDLGEFPVGGAYGVSLASGNVNGGTFLVAAAVGSTEKFSPSLDRCVPNDVTFGIPLLPRHFTCFCDQLVKECTDGACQQGCVASSKQCSIIVAGFSWYALWPGAALLPSCYPEEVSYCETRCRASTLCTTGCE